MTISRAPRRATLIAAFVGASLGTLATAVVSAQTGATVDLSRRVSFDIPAQPLSSALMRFSAQTRVDLSASTDLVEGKQSAALKGTYTTDEALRILLRGTGLEFTATDGGVVAIKAVREGDVEKASAMRSTGALRLAQAESDQSSMPRSEERSDARPVSHSAEPERAQLEEIIVTGSHIAGIRPPGQQLITLTAADIARSGHTNAADVVRSLPQVFAGSIRDDQFATTGTTDRAANTNTSASSGIDLRGMGVGATLVLLNGRRLAPGGLVGAFADVSFIPVSAIERVEILPDGASALYGADAVGGVVNFILKQRYEGAETRVNLGSVTSGDRQELQISQSLGQNWQDGSALLALEYNDRDSLSARERDRTNADLRPWGGSDFRQTQCNPGTLLVGSTEYVIPGGQDGADLTPAQLVRGRNLCNQNEDLDLFPQERRWNAFAHAEHNFTDALRGFVDVFYAKRTTTRLSRNVITLTVPNTNAFYVHPTGGTGAVRVRYDLRDDLGPSRTEFDNDSINAVAGMELGLGEHWSFTATTGPSRVEEHQRNNQGVDAAALASALADPNPATAFNPFGEGSNTSEATLARLANSHLVQFRTSSRLWESNIVANGSLLDLPAGAVRLALGVNHHEARLETLNRQEGLVSQVIEINTPASLEREVYAGFGELFVPFVGAANRARLVERLDLSIAARYEHFSDFGATLVPRVGLTWSPFSDFSVRGTYSKSFKAPLLPDLSQAANTNLIVNDPVSGSAVLYATGGNSELDPETATTWSAGVQYAPAGSEFSMSATYFSTRFKDRLGAITALAITEANEPVITRNPTAEQRAAICGGGAFTGNFSTAPGDCLTAPIGMIFDARTRNLAELEQSGIDFLTSYRLNVGANRLSFALNATYLFDYARRITASSPLLDVADTPGNPLTLRLRGSIGWDYANFAANAFVNYQDDYEDTVSVPNRDISSWTTVDLSLSYAFDEDSGPALEGVRVSLNALNLFDREPPFFNNPAAIAYDPSNANLLGRFVSIDLSKSW